MIRSSAFTVQQEVTLKPEEVRLKMKEAIDAARKLGDEQNLPEDVRLAIESMGEGWLNTFDAFFAHAEQLQGSEYAGR